MTGNLRRTIARDWLIFVALVGLTVLAAPLGYYFKYGSPRTEEIKPWEQYAIAHDPDRHPEWFKQFWRDFIKYPEARTILPWLLGPYAAVTFLRTLVWSAKSLQTRN